MKAIWKYSIPIEGEFTINMPEGAVPLCVQVQDNVPCIWVLVRPGPQVDCRRFRLHGTGRPLDDVGLGRYVGTFQMGSGALVWHLFDHGSAP